MKCPNCGAQLLEATQVDSGKHYERRLVSIANDMCEINELCADEWEVECYLEHHGEPLAVLMRPLAV